MTQKLQHFNTFNSAFSMKACSENKCRQTKHTHEEIYPIYNGIMCSMDNFRKYSNEEKFTTRTSDETRMADLKKQNAPRIIRLNHVKKKS